MSERWNDEDVRAFEGEEGDFGGESFAGEFAEREGGDTAFSGEFGEREHETHERESREAPFEPPALG